MISSFGMSWKTPEVWGEKGFIISQPKAKVRLMIVLTRRGKQMIRPTLTHVTTEIVTVIVSRRFVTFVVESLRTNAVENSILSQNPVLALIPLL